MLKSLLIVGLFFLILQPLFAADPSYDSSLISVRCPDPRRPDFSEILYRGVVVREANVVGNCRSWAAERNSEILSAQDHGLKVVIVLGTNPGFRTIQEKNDTFVVDQKKYFELLTENSKLKARLSACEGKKSKPDAQPTSGAQSLDRP